MALVPFLLIVFGLASGIAALFILLPNQMAEVFGEWTGQHPLFYLAVYAPAIKLLSLASYITETRQVCGVILADCCSGAAHWVGMPF